jgi:signal peptidase
LNNNTPKKSGVFDALHIVSLVVFSIIMLGGMLIYAAPHIGWLVDGVRSDSMTPAITRGALVIAKPEQPGNIVLNDIIVFRSDSAKENYVCHRVIGISLQSPLSFDTKGDANPFKDPEPVPARNLIAKVVSHIPVLGFAAIFIKTPLGFIVSIVVPGLVIGYICLSALFSELFKKKKRG